MKIHVPHFTYSFHINLLLKGGVRLTYIFRGGVGFVLITIVMNQYYNSIYIHSATNQNIASQWCYYHPTHILHGTDLKILSSQSVCVG